jgi:hypothetical protein
MNRADRGSKGMVVVVVVVAAAAAAAALVKTHPSYSFPLLVSRMGGNTHIPTHNAPPRAPVRRSQVWRRWPQTAAPRRSCRVAFPPPPPRPSAHRRGEAVGRRGGPSWGPRARRARWARAPGGGRSGSFPPRGGGGAGSAVAAGAAPWHFFRRPLSRVLVLEGCLCVCVCDVSVHEEEG